jgi:septal ring factor EnvC (AmiA/AmiB activator)
MRKSTVKERFAPIRTARAQLADLAALARSAYSLALEAAGWDGQSAKQHIQLARSVSAQAEELARSALDDQAELTARVAELEAQLEEIDKELTAKAVTHVNLASRLAFIEARISGADHG